MNLELAGKRALVTGASRGIGRAIAERLATEGRELLLVARTEADLRAAADEIAAASGRKVEVCVADLSKISGIEAVAGWLGPSPGGLDILVNNAGAAKGGTIFELQEEDWQAGFELKFYGALRLIRKLWPLLKKARGTVVNVTGYFGKTPAPNIILGGAINAAFENASKALAQMGLVDDVNVNVVRPGMTMTDRQRALLVQWGEAQGLTGDEAEQRRIAAMGLRRAGEPQDVAAMTAFLASPLARHINGAILPVDGGGTGAL
jgi:3-oxoacyl-[acyl-carrier protein] reductase